MSQTLFDLHGVLISASAHPTSRTDAASDRLATVAAILRHEADALETILPTGGTDVRADVARLREIAGNVDGYGQTRGRAA